jgi:DnaK suppressor protein
VDIEDFKRRLIEQEQVLAARLEREDSEGLQAGDELVEEPGDSGDASIGSERKEERLRGAQADWQVLREVRQALERIEAGTFGTCIVDGGPIEPKRLDAVPWTPYCLAHQRQREGPDADRTSTM